MFDDRSVIKTTAHFFMHAYFTRTICVVCESHSLNNYCFVTWGIVGTNNEIWNYNLSRENLFIFFTVVLSILLSITDIEKRLLDRKSHPLLGHPASNAIHLLQSLDLKPAINEHEIIRRTAAVKVCANHL